LLNLLQILFNVTQNSLNNQQVLLKIGRNFSWIVHLFIIFTVSEMTKLELNQTFFKQPFLLNINWKIPSLFSRLYPTICCHSTFLPSFFISQHFTDSEKYLQRENLFPCVIVHVPACFDKRRDAREEKDRIPLDIRIVGNLISKNDGREGKQ
jgi:hypothetical protein